MPLDPPAVGRRVCPTKELLAQAVASELADVLAAAIGSRGQATMVLTGGSMGTALVSALAQRAHGPLAAGDPGWASVNVWWGDERFVPQDDPDRNDTHARQAGLDRLGLATSRVHPAPTPEQVAGQVAEAARRYGEQLRDELSRPDGQVIDVVMLGVGSDGHVASLFPGHPALLGDLSTPGERLVVAVEDSPKPPPQRVSWTASALSRACRVWFLVSGSEKAEAVSSAWSNPPVAQVPAAGVVGRSETLWWLDAAASGG